MFFFIMLALVVSMLFDATSHVDSDNEHSDTSEASKNNGVVFV